MERLEGAGLADDIFGLRYFGEHGDDRLLMINLGRQCVLEPMAEPLIAPPSSDGWRTAWSSEHPRYGGSGFASMDGDDAVWTVPADSATLLLPAE
jgi:maltooligosyltrehalose trehalohydrolase